jgi:hypothetical protein
LLCLNLWFVLEVLKVLRAVRDGLVLFARWVDERSAQGKREANAGSGASDDLKGLS